MAVSSVEVRFPAGEVRTLPDGSSVSAALHLWAPDRDTEFVAALLDGRAVDLSATLHGSVELAPLAFDDRSGRDIVQHSAAHLVAKALTELIPAALPVNGPPTDEGFYYDFDVRPLSPADLDAIRERMQRDIAAKLPYERIELPLEEARGIFANNRHKLRVLDTVALGEVVSGYRTGTFFDLCRGPHVPDTGWLAGAHVLGFSAAGGNEPGTSASVQRVRGVAFPTKSELDAYLALRKEAEARDHRALGVKLDLFSFSDELPGFPFWHPRGMVIVRELERFVQEHLAEAGYSEIRTPLMFPQSTYERSGHWELFRENMFLLEEGGRNLGIKPMNCPGSMLIFGQRDRSYRELPMRLAEFAPLHRLEPSGTLHGLTRVREFVQDDAHVFVTEEQIGPEIRVLIAWIRQAMETFRLSWRAELSTRPARFLGEAATWDRAETTLKQILESEKVEFKISPGEGAFYGPKIDFHLRDSLGRSWQCGTIQLDYQMPARFGLRYQGPDGSLRTPIVVHRVILGTWERFLGILLEHTNGRLPPWLSPTQVKVLPVTERQSSAARGLVDELRQLKVRAELGGTDESLAKRIRECEVGRVPYAAVLGDQELANGTVAARISGSKGSQSFSRPEFLERVKERVRVRSFEP